MSNILILLVLFVIIIYLFISSYELWVNPNSYLKKAKARRSRIDKSRIGKFLKINSKNIYGNNPTFEIWYERILYATLFIVVFLVLIATGVSR